MDKYEAWKHKQFDDKNFKKHLSEIQTMNKSLVFCEEICYDENDKCVGKKAEGGHELTIQDINDDSGWWDEINNQMLYLYKPNSNLQFAIINGSIMQIIEGSFPVEWNVELFKSMYGDKRLKELDIYDSHSAYFKYNFLNGWIETVKCKFDYLNSKLKAV